MNLEETLSLIETLRASGVKKFKSHEHEIEFTNGAVAKITQKANPQLDLPLTPEQSKKVEEATAGIKDMISTLNLSPQQMADKMFADNVSP